MADKVLIVDDDDAIVQSLCDVLSEEGYEVAGANDGREALDWLRLAPPPCLILLDWMMPRCDGAAFRAEQLSDAKLAAIPVVLLTADYHLDRKKRQISAAAYLRKPVRLRDLFGVIEQFCHCPTRA